MKQALVIASFGTSVPEARSSIEAVEKTLIEAVDDYTAIRAFTSPTIRRILAKRGEEVPSLPEALEQLRARGVRRAAVQPTHLLYGFEYDKLRAEAEALSAGFDVLSVGRPLLADTAALLRFAAGLAGMYPREEGGAVVLMGHGTEHFANAVYPALQTALRLAGREDVLVGIAASGRTPYVLGAMAYARSLGAPVVSVTCCPGSPVTEAADIAIAPAPGPEVVTGSTRMKSGTAQKMVLNMLSTGAMIKLGKVYGNLMVDVKPSNEKLIGRCRRIVCTAAEVDGETAGEALERCGWRPKTAIVMLRLGVDAEAARKLLEDGGGRVAAALERGE